MTQETIQLRGHHLSNLAYTYWESAERLPSTEDAFIKRSIIEFMEERYGKEFLSWKTDFNCSLLSQPDTIVHIVEGLDSICNKPCPVYTEKSCINRSHTEDAETLKEYGLKAGDKLKVSELIRVFEKYKERTWFWAPRQKIWQDEDRRIKAEIEAAK